MRTIDLKPDPLGHAAPITHVAFRPDGKRLASCSYDGTVLVWDTSEPARPVPLTRLRHRRLVNAAAWSPTAPTLLATASADKTVAVWRIPEHGQHRLVTVLARHTDDINSVAWMPDGRRLICVSEDGRATMWDTPTGALLAEIGSHAAHCMMVSVSCEGLVATVGEDGMVAVGDPGRPATAEMRHYASSVEGCAWSHSGKLLAVARDDGVVNLLTPDLECLRTVTVSTAAARSVAWADDDCSIVVGAYDGSLHWIDISGEPVRQVHDARLWPRSVASARGLVAAGSFWNAPHLLDFATGAELSAPERPGHGANALAVLRGHPRGDSAPAGRSPGERPSRERPPGERLGVESPSGEGSPGESPSGDRLLVGCDSGSVLALDLADGTDGSPAGVRVLPVSASPVLSLAAGPDGTFYAGTYAGHVIRHDGEDMTVSAPLGAPVPSLCLAGDRLVAGTYNGELIALDPVTLAEVERGAPHAGSVKSLSAFDGGFLSAATDRTVAAGPLHDRATLWQHGNLVNAVAGLGDRVVASASRDHTVKVGLLAPSAPAGAGGRATGGATGGRRAANVQTLLGPDESVKCVGLLGDPDAPVVLAGSYDFGLYAWEIDWQDSVGTLGSGRLVSAFRQGLSCMTPWDERRMVVAGWDGRLSLVGRQGPDAPVRELRSWQVEELIEQAEGAGSIENADALGHGRVAS
ncbi:WD40 repeat domain-containing protein [Streptomyces sp. NPDC059096]|uniref:WD40 repeat domain-containing protein n=1 Tax=Streptomyces sp. NPDC059096 TaxID=3346727 RepID=UPI0036CDC120